MVPENVYFDWMASSFGPFIKRWEKMGHYFLIKTNKNLMAQ